jgi:hypothetical protein
VRSARHKDLVERSKDPFSPAEVKDRPNLEADVRYRRCGLVPAHNCSMRAHAAACSCLTTLSHTATGLTTAQSWLQRRGTRLRPAWQSGRLAYALRDRPCS